MRFKLEIDCDNAAFEDQDAELARCLRDVADRIEGGEGFTFYRNILDINGNIVGRFAIKPE